MRSITSFGLPHVCKGYTGILMKKIHPDEIEIIGTGDLIRDKSRIDHAFKQHADAIMERRELVSDEIIFELVEERLATITDPRKILYLDGFRTVDQLIWLEKHGLLAKDRSMAVLFSAETEVLHARAIHRRNSKPGGSRPDDDKLEDNFAAGQRVFNEAWPALKEYLTQVGIRIENVNANGDIVQTVLPQVDIFFYQISSLPIPRTAEKVTSMSRSRHCWRQRARAYA